MQDSDAISAQTCSSLTVFPKSAHFGSFDEFYNDFTAVISANLNFNIMIHLFVQHGLIHFLTQFYMARMAQVDPLLRSWVWLRHNDRAVRTCIIFCNNVYYESIVLFLKIKNMYYESSLYTTDVHANR